MISVTFETAGLAAAVGKAARVAPSKGMAFDKAAGILIEGRTKGFVDKPITIKATNLEVDYLEWVEPLELKADEDFNWRLNSQLLAGFVTGLPIGSGKTVTITQDADNARITMKSGKTKAMISPIVGRSYKEWEAFDGSDLKEVTGFASRINQAGWATDRETVPYSGIHIDGEHIYATDRYRMVRVPCEVPISRPVTVPLDTLAPILKTVEDVRLGVDDRSLMLMPDEYTQMRTVIFDADYPPIERAMKTDFDRVVTLPRIAFREAASRMLGLVGRGERYPRLVMRMHDGLIEMGMEVEGVGSMTDEIEVTTENVEIGNPTKTEPIDLFFTPTYLTEALDKTRADTVTLSYRTDTPYRVARVSDGQGYDVWLMPRKPTDPAPIKKDDDA